jgi:hypothetical protein
MRLRLWDKQVAFETLKGQVVTKITASDDTISFETQDGSSYLMYHSQDCCESVYVESIVGDLDDLLDSEVLLAEEVSNETPPDWTADKYAESYTWTFYKLATRKGYVDIRWFGESNGYYSESVEFAKVK